MIKVEIVYCRLPLAAAGAFYFAPKTLLLNLPLIIQTIMPPVRYRLFHLLLLPLIILFTQCNNNASTDTTVEDTAIAPEDTSTLSGIKTSDVVISETVRNALIFHIDDTMRIGTGYKATLALGKDQVLEDLEKEMQEATDAQMSDLKVDTSLRVEAEMRARLKDLSPASDRSFDISALSEDGDVQEINEETGNRAFWQWNVVPLKKGKHKLQLVVEVVLNKKRAIYLPSKTMEVIIDAKAESYGAMFGSFMEKYWQWFITAIIIPLIIAWVTTRIRQRQQAGQSAPPKQEPPKKK